MPIEKGSRNTEQIIYIKLMYEGIGVWQQVKYEKIDDNIYRLSEQPYDGDDEVWEFEHGATVLCNRSEKTMRQS